jgi:S-adenosylmethionine hydrolase
MPVITLLTDFGLSDTFIGVMKGVIWSIAPGAQIADLTHEIPPQNVLEAAMAIAEAAPYFPAGTIHTCVVDPGVGTARRPMLALIGGQYFVGPDNGIFSLLIDNAEDLTTPPVYIDLNKPRFWLPQVSKSFHGRDIFAPVAAHLASGVPFEELGDPFDDPVRIAIPVPQKTAHGCVGQVLHVDHFGNLITNITPKELQANNSVIVHVKDRTIKGLTQTFGSCPSGELIAMFDSGGHLEISVVNGSAAALLNVGSGEPVKLSFNKEVGA